jgi:hypothetical protein
MQMRILGPRKDENNEWRKFIMNNFTVHTVDIDRLIKSRGMRFARYLVGMGKGWSVMQMLIGSIPIGRFRHT